MKLDANKSCDPVINDFVFLIINYQHYVVCNRSLGGGIIIKTIKIENNCNYPAENPPEDYDETRGGSRCF